MTRTLLLVSALLLFTLAACAPVVYEPLYYRAYDPTPAYVVANPVHVQTTTVYHRAAPAVASIAITLYADRSWRGLTFSPLRLVLTDGQYAAIPVRDKKGRPATIYAHYHRQSLHFDADRNCRTIHGAPVYRYDSRWDHGHTYSRLHVGNDFDLNGLRLEIRSLSAGPGRAGSQAVAPAVHRPAGHERQPVVWKPMVAVPARPAATISARHVTTTPVVQRSRQESADLTQPRAKIGKGAQSSLGAGRMTAAPGKVVRPAQPVRIVQSKPVRPVVKESSAKVAVPTNRSRPAVSNVSISGEKQKKLVLRNGQSVKPAKNLRPAGKSQGVGAGKASGSDVRVPAQKKSRNPERVEGTTTGADAHLEASVVDVIAERSGESEKHSRGERRTRPAR